MLIEIEDEDRTVTYELKHIRITYWQRGYRRMRFVSRGRALDEGCQTLVFSGMLDKIPRIGYGD